VGHTGTDNGCNSFAADPAAGDNQTSAAGTYAHGWSRATPSHATDTAHGNCTPIDSTQATRAAHAHRQINAQAADTAIAAHSTDHQCGDMIANARVYAPISQGAGLVHAATVIPP
jgi:hypothetical protein